MEILKEVTVWDDEALNRNNGIYWLNDAGHLIAYQAPGQMKKEFKTPLKQFSKARRKFIKLNDLPDNP
jgi:hypothetical protein